MTDFFIAGSPKCGTTALFEYLASHPGVFIPACKEPNYFCGDLRISGVRTQADYDALYSAAPCGALTGDASSMYLYSGIALQRIAAHNPAARVIVMLRHPASAARSLYAARHSHGHENAPDFEHAWRWQADRLQGKRLPSRWPDPRTLQYGAIYRYAPQVQRLLQQLPRTQCLFLVYEEFFADPARHFPQVLKFLDLPEDPGRQAFPRINATSAARSGSLQRLLNRPPPWLRKTAHAMGLRPRAILERWNRRAEPLALGASFSRELETHFAADIAATEALLGRRLWPAQLTATPGHSA